MRSLGDIPGFVAASVSNFLYKSGQLKQISEESGSTQKRRSQSVRLSQSSSRTGWDSFELSPKAQKGLRSVKSYQDLTQRQISAEID